MLKPLALLILTGFAPISFADDCRFEFSPSAAKVGWTAFKTTAKAPVSGTFKQIRIEGPSSGKSLPEILGELTASVDLGSSSTDNAVRDANLKTGFFDHLKGKATARVLNARGGPETGSFDLELRLNGVRRKVPMTYSFSESEGFKAKGAGDILQFKGSGAMNALSKVCGDLHKGADGISKTWSEFEIHLSAPASKTCR